ncbi:MAG: hypothetical protein IPM82_11715 [Saprospiraceae bacterium]|nr:hypothetical protein [Saprospiraceae bacterium]
MQNGQDLKSTAILPTKGDHQSSDSIKANILSYYENTGLDCSEDDAEYLYTSATGAHECDPFRRRAILAEK